MPFFRGLLTIACFQWSLLVGFREIYDDGLSRSGYTLRSKLVSEIMSSTSYFARTSRQWSRQKSELHGCGQDATYTRFDGYPKLFTYPEITSAVTEIEIQDQNDCARECRNIETCQAFIFYPGTIKCSVYPITLTGLEPPITVNEINEMLPPDSDKNDDAVKQLLQEIHVCYVAPEVIESPREKPRKPNKRSIYFNRRIPKPSGTPLKTIRSTTIPACKVECDQTDKCNSFIFAGPKYQFNDYGPKVADCELYTVETAFIEKQLDMAARAEYQEGRDLMFFKHLHSDELYFTSGCPSEIQTWSDVGGAKRVIEARSAQLCLSACAAHSCRTALYNDNQKRCVLTSKTVSLSSQMRTCPQGVVAYSLMVHGCCCRYAAPLKCAEQGGTCTWADVWIPGQRCSFVSDDACPIQDDMILWGSGSGVLQTCWSGQKQEGPGNCKVLVDYSSSCDNLQVVNDQNTCRRAKVEFEPTDAAPVCVYPEN